MVACDICREEAQYTIERRKGCWVGSWIYDDIHLCKEHYEAFEKWFERMQQEADKEREKHAKHTVETA